MKRRIAASAVVSVAVGVLAGCGNHDAGVEGSSQLSDLASSIPSRPEVPTEGWKAAPPEGPKTSNVPLPPGFPSMQLPPPKIDVPPGQPQPVATKYGITYTVPADWKVSPIGSIGWEGPHGLIVGTIGEFGRNYCRDDKGDVTQAFIGGKGRNGVDIDTAARELTENLEPLFTEDDGRKPKFEVRGPTPMQVSGAPAVRYTATIGGLTPRTACSPTEIRFDIVATTGYSNAEVAMFVVKRNVAPANPVSDATVDGILSSLTKS